MTYFVNTFLIFTIFYVKVSALDLANFRDTRPCGAAIDKCISETRNTELGGCLGTAYGLYFAGENKISYCSNGNFNAKCLGLDQAAAIGQCVDFGPFPASCTVEISRCIYNLGSE